MSGQGGRYQRSAAGMIGAMLVLVAVVIGFVVLRDLNRTAPQGPVVAVDYQQGLVYARQRASFEVLAPDDLPPGWRATTVEFTPDPPQWHLGVLTDQDRYVGLEQAVSSAESMARMYVDREAVRGEDVMIDGEPWTLWSDSGGDTALTRTQGEVTTLVVGTVERDVLVDYVELLR